MTTKEAKVYLFDVDGTLTEPRQKITSEFKYFFLEWMKDKIVYLVSGSDIEKIRQQIPEEIERQCAGIYCCMANEYYEGGKLVYSNKFNPPKNLLSDLEEIIRQSDYPTKVGKHIEHRPGMINFSVVGRNANLQERDNYFKYDCGNKEREKIVKRIGSIYPEFDFAVGGSISIDIYPKGQDKSQVIPLIRKRHGSAPVVFMGDRTAYPGNDYAIVASMARHENYRWYQVDSWKETQKYLMQE